MTAYNITAHRCAKAACHGAMDIGFTLFTGEDWCIVSGFFIISYLNKYTSLK